MHNGVCLVQEADRLVIAIEKPEEMRYGLHAGAVKRMGMERDGGLSNLQCLLHTILSLEPMSALQSNPSPVWLKKFGASEERFSRGEVPQIAGRVRLQGQKLRVLLRSLAVSFLPAAEFQPQRERSPAAQNLVTILRLGFGMTRVRLPGAQREPHGQPWCATIGGYAGGQAEYARVPFADIGPIKIENGLTDEQVLFLSDILPTGWMAAEQCDIEHGDTVAVWGCGPVGQASLGMFVPFGYM